jgi:ribosomal protein S18 acetylase RimI-like enzyme
MTQRKTLTRPVRLELPSPKDAGLVTVVAAFAFFEDRKRMPEQLRRDLLATEDPSTGPLRSSYHRTRRVLESLNPDCRRSPSSDHKALLGDSILIGGLLAIARANLGEGEWRCEGICVDPDDQNRGIGQETVRKMYRVHPAAKRWSLGTPESAVLNRCFYEKTGFTLVEITDVEPQTAWKSREYENALPHEERVRR